MEKFSSTKIVHRNIFFVLLQSIDNVQVRAAQPQHQGHRQQIIDYQQNNSNNESNPIRNHHPAVHGCAGSVGR
jgi:hypothetical protein